MADASVAPRQEASDDKAFPVMDEELEPVLEAYRRGDLDPYMEAVDGGEDDPEVRARGAPPWSGHAGCGPTHIMRACMARWGRAGPKCLQGRGRGARV